MELKDWNCFWVWIASVAGESREEEGAVCWWGSPRYVAYLGPY